MISSTLLQGRLSRMSFEMSSTSVICSKCGTAYGRRKGSFPVSYAALHKGIGYTYICKECIDSLYNTYLDECGDSAKAVRQICRKLDLYWNEDVFSKVENISTTKTMMTQYLSKINTVKYAGKCYDDTLREEGVLWSFNHLDIDDFESEDTNSEPSTSVLDLSEVPDEIIASWGPGYSPEKYLELEKRREYWMSSLPEGTEVGIGGEAILKQICSLELDINRDRAKGKSVDKNVNTLNTLLGSINLKPTQKKDESDSGMEDTPFGVWIKKWEDQRPIPEPDPSLQDVDGIVRYIEIWFKGHLSKMLNIKNSYSKLYEEEMSKIRVAHPEYEDEDDED